MENEQFYPIRDGSVRAFNLGCDARLAGRSRYSNPYSNDFLVCEWTRGWDHVDTYWGVDAPWPVLKLVEVN